MNKGGLAQRVMAGLMPLNNRMINSLYEKRLPVGFYTMTGGGAVSLYSGFVAYDQVFKNDRLITRLAHPIFWPGFIPALGGTRPRSRPNNFSGWVSGPALGGRSVSLAQPLYTRIKCECQTKHFRTRSSHRCQRPKPAWLSRGYLTRHTRGDRAGQYQADIGPKWHRA